MNCDKRQCRLYLKKTSTFERMPYKTHQIYLCSQVKQGLITASSQIARLLYRNEHYHGNASEYLPRWLRSQQTNENVNVLKASSPIVFLPFGFAPRNCVGRRVVSMELQLGVARLIRNFEVEFHCSTENAFGNIQLIVPNIPLRFQFIDCEILVLLITSAKQFCNLIQNHLTSSLKPFVKAIYVCYISHQLSREENSRTVLC
ncbi:hypothetical protein GQX74_011053 [Glossina fuscipes]|nr:hypothetical protein GQX74_011053 [Glossina fuscipes]